jgi:exodeoxyribonuclease VII large subunit
VHDLLESGFPDVWVEGEVSDPRAYPSGHTYFTLKDAEAQISAVLFKGFSANLKFKVEHGLQVLARGRVSTYIKRGQYQFIATCLEPKAAGALQLAFEQLKKKLQAEGLFDEARKRRLPPFPRRIGIVTSLKGAAIRDILSILGRRFQGLHIRIMPVQVQGDEAAGQVARAVGDFNEHFPDTDVLLVGRGGGSLEDLWAFNEEVVARAIAASKIPVVSCVGHETDFTIADFVADLRAPTPSAAAELVVPERREVLSRVAALQDRAAAALRSTLQPLRERLSVLLRSPFLRQPARIFEQRLQRVDELTARLVPGLRGLVRRLDERVPELLERVLKGVQQALARAEGELGRRMEHLDALSPLKVLGRGYAIAFHEGQDASGLLPGLAEPSEGKGSVLKTTRRLKRKDLVRVRLHEGQFTAKVEEIL